MKILGLLFTISVLIITILAMRGTRKLSKSIRNGNFIMSPVKTFASTKSVKNWLNAKNVFISIIVALIVFALYSLI